MKIDSHQHFWKYNEEEFAWITPQMARIRRDFMPQDLRDELINCGFDGCIAVQARQSIEETRFLLDLADKYDFIKGVVGWVDLRSDELPQQLNEFAKNAMFKGVRHVIHDEPDDRFMLAEDFQRGIATLTEYDLAYDLLVFPKHLEHAETLVKSFPRQRFVIDHLAKPDIKNHNHSRWAEDITSVAKSPNVWCKISGMVTEARPNEWKKSDFDFYLDTVYEAFGPDRLMIGSDWPVCLAAAKDYKSVMDIAADYVKNKGEEAGKKIMGLNAINFYQL